MCDPEMPPSETHTRNREVPLYTQALMIALQWRRRAWNQQIGVATEYMRYHAGTTALLTLVEALDPEVIMTFCIFNVPLLIEATNEVISSTLCLPNSLFCPLVLWAARRLSEDAIECMGVIERTPARPIRNACVTALGIQFDSTVIRI